jgi:hypothetical protein
VDPGPVAPGEITGRDQEEGEESQAAQAERSGPDPGEIARHPPDQGKGDT